MVSLHIACRNYEAEGIQGEMMQVILLKWFQNVLRVRLEDADLKEV